MGAALSSTDDPTLNHEIVENNCNTGNSKARVLLYMYHGGIYPSTRKHAGKLLGFPPGLNDIFCRIHYDKLVKVVVQNRNALVQNVYGRMPANIVEAAQQEGVTINHINSRMRSNLCQRKQMAVRLTADAVEDIVLNKPLPENPNGDTVVLVSGVQEMCPIIKKARDNGWNVEVWAYSNFVAEAIMEEAQQENGQTKVTIMPLDEHFNEFAFDEYKDYNKSIPVDRALLLTFKDGAAFMNGLDAEKKLATKEMIITTAKKFFRLPVALKSIESGESQDMKYALIIMAHEKDRGRRERRYNFNLDVVHQKELFRDTVEASMVQGMGKLNISRPLPSINAKGQVPPRKLK